MNTEQFRQTIDELHKRLVDLTASKGEEYKRREDNQFANFERGAAALGLTREQVLLVYASKHYDSIVTYVKDHASGRPAGNYAEPITGRIDDLILYMLLFRGMVEDAELATDENFALDMPHPEPEVWVNRCPYDHPRDTVCPSCEKSRPEGAKHGAVVEIIPDVVISPDWDLAVKACQYYQLTVGTHALSTVDQLFGIAPSKMVFFIATGDPAKDGPMLGELQLRSQTGKFKLAASYYFAKVGHQQA
jgi:hypothetical protein